VPDFKVKGRRTLEEAILGVTNIKNMNGMDLNTSVGFPLNYKYHNKKQLIKIVEDKNKRSVIVDPELRDLHEKNMDKRKNGEVPLTIFHCVGKDERKSEAKIHKPRLIQGGPVEYTFATRRLTQDFTACFYQNKLKSFSAVGVDCLGSDFAKMCAKMRWHDNIICGDIKNFGPTLQNEVVVRVYSIINSWYNKYDKGDSDDKEQNAFMRKVLQKEAVSCLNAAYDCVFRVPSGSPSGHPLTVVINTICNVMYVYMAYKRIFPKSNYNKFKEEVDVLTYGDDLWLSVSPDISDKFNNVTLSQVYADVGIIYTDIDKKSVTKKFVKMQESAFLGRTPVQFEDVYVGQLDYDVVCDILNWTKNTGKKAKIAEDSTVRGVLIELFFHGKNVFEQAREKLAVKADQKVFNGFNWSDLYNKWKNNSLSLPLSYEEQFLTPDLDAHEEQDVSV